MGAGKSEVGDALAGRLGRMLLDTDLLVEQVAGMPIPEIFAREGELGFRALEAGAVRQAAAVPGAVIACGGGVVLDPANVHVLRRSGVIVYLRVSPAVAAARVGDGAGRPLLAGGDPAGRLAAVIEERSNLYEAAADLTVDADAPADAVAEAIVRSTGAGR